ncbi:uncharacterized protein SPSK_06710 [Sporothrix schenckii 1099-18]|uniref:Uncharacterized protein n=1 Tax=Sporothrix schenckii 1099-18 TaxID=1397361 RepID=A0A0F2MHX0_SPOSC|nr:uncharacterized protein SPSK_06710 [Sporothrix schenckii 1099-18]KJR89298.1 hypothetical protein SPSK_06710 [Sporothrix schenckii 1099-18]
MRTLEDLELYDVVHDDVNYTNMAWNEELQRVMAFDLDYAYVEPVRRPGETQTPERKQTAAPGSSPLLDIDRPGQVPAGQTGKEQHYRGERKCAAGRINSTAIWAARQRLLLLLYPLYLMY